VVRPFICARSEVVMLELNRKSGDGDTHFHRVGRKHIGGGVGALLLPPNPVKAVSDNVRAIVEWQNTLAQARLDSQELLAPFRLEFYSEN
jgi:hypothetical protein